MNTRKRIVFIFFTFGAFPFSHFPISISASDEKNGILFIGKSTFFSFLPVEESFFFKSLKSSQEKKKREK